MAEVGELLGLGGVAVPAGVLDGVVMLGTGVGEVGVAVGVEAIEGGLTGEATGVLGGGLLLVVEGVIGLGEGTAGVLTAGADVTGAPGVKGEVTGDAGMVVLKGDTKPGHLPQVICNRHGLSSCVNYRRHKQTIASYCVPDSTQEVVLVPDL